MVYIPHVNLTHIMGKKIREDAKQLKEAVTNISDAYLEYAHARARLQHRAIEGTRTITRVNKPYLTATVANKKSWKIREEATNRLARLISWVNDQSNSKYEPLVLDTIQEAFDEVDKLYKKG